MINSSVLSLPSSGLETFLLQRDQEKFAFAVDVMKQKPGLNGCGVFQKSPKHLLLS